MASPDPAARAGSQGHPGIQLALRVVAGLAPIILVVWCLAHLHRGTGTELTTAAFLGVCYIAAFRTLYTSDRGAAVPTEPVLVAMLLALPATWVPPLVLIAGVLASVDDDENLHMTWWQVALTLGRHAFLTVSPVLVVLALGHTGLHDASPGLIAAVLGTQILTDGLLAALIEIAGQAARTVIKSIAWTMGIDATLAVVGYCITEATHARLPGLFLLAAPIVLMHLLSYDREQYFSQAQDYKSAYREVNQEARRDPMTGLLNRRGWEETLASTMARLRETPEPMTATILAADLDRLKYTNDTYGHLAGDSLICGFADLLTDILPPECAVARLGGDEFAVIITGRSDAEHPDLLSTVREALATADPVGSVRISASLGQATCPPAVDLDTAVQEADHAARVDKEMRRMRREDHSPARPVAP